MPKVFLENVDAVPMAQALKTAFASFGCEPLGGPSEDGWSKMLDFQRCEYRYYLKHELGAVPIGGDARTALEIGELIHACLALHYCRALPEGYPGWRANPPSPLLLLDTLENLGVDMVALQTARRLYYGYAEHYVNEDIQPVAIEFPFGKVGDHTCRYDMLAVHQGALWVYEHKSASSESADVLEGWWLDGEIIGEVYVARKYQIEKLFGMPLAGVLINLMFKTTVGALSGPEGEAFLRGVVAHDVAARIMHGRATLPEAVRGRILGLVEGVAASGRA